MPFKWKKKKKKRRQWSFWLIVLPVAFSVLSFFWIKGAWSAAHASVQYRLDSRESVNYPDLLAEQQNRPSPLDNIAVRGLIVLAVYIVIFASIMLHAEPKRGALMLILLMPGSLIGILGLCGGCFWLSVSSRNYTQFDHLDSAEFDGHIYHLTLTDEFLAQAQRLYIFECDLSGEDCVHIDSVSWYGATEQQQLRFVVDEIANQLQVRAGSKLHFRLSAAQP